jgi:peptide deformylase
MSILKVSRMGHPVLRKKIKPLPQSEIVTPSIQRLIDDMIHTMMEYRGAGLAAPQVHEELRLFVGLISDESEDDEQDEAKEPARPEFLVVINPEITQIGRVTEEDWEGCLSLPDLRGRVPRAHDIRLRGFDRTGQHLDLKLSGFTARMAQHETDHLDGILFIDRMESFESLSFIEEASRYHLGQD